MSAQRLARRDVADVHEVAGLASVLEDLGRVPRCERAAKHARNSRVRRVARHPGAVDVVVPQRGDAHTRVFAGEAPTQMLLMELRRRVDVARVDGRTLGHRQWYERRTAPRTRRFETTRTEIVDGTRSGDDVAVLLAR